MREGINPKKVAMMTLGLACLLAIMGTLFLTTKSSSDGPDKGYLRHPGKNIFWQYANFTARTSGVNNTCYACALIPHAAADPFVFELYTDTYNTVNQTWLKNADTDANVFLKGNRGKLDADIQFGMTSPRLFPICFRRFDRELENDTDSEAPNDCIYLEGGGETCTRLPGNQTSSWQRGLDPNQCNSTVNLVRDFGGVTTDNMHRPIWIPDWYWYCGHRLLFYLPTLQRGRCALVRLSAHIVLYSMNPRLRTQRDTYTDLSVPDEHKMVSESARFAEILFPMWGVGVLRRDLTRVHYRLATFVNQTIRGFEGVRSELTALRLMTTQNRMALDLLLAKEGGVCSMIGKHCCTYVPPNDAPGGNISDVLYQMRTVAAQLNNEERGAESWLWDWGSTLAGLRTVFFMVLPILLFLVFLLFCGPLLCNCLTEVLFRHMQKKGQFLQVTVDTIELDTAFGLDRLFNEDKEN